MMFSFVGFNERDDDIELIKLFRSDLSFTEAFHKRKGGFVILLCFDGAYIHCCSSSISSIKRDRLSIHFIIFGMSSHKLDVNNLRLIKHFDN